MRLVREMLYDGDDKETYLLFIFNLFSSVLSLPVVLIVFAAGPVWDRSQHSNRCLGSLENLCFALKNLAARLNRRCLKPVTLEPMRTDEFCPFTHRLHAFFPPITMTFVLTLVLF